MKLHEKIFAFTLAEVLITLGIIGVVAAITMPTLIKNYQKYKTVNQLKKVYTVLNQAYKMSEIDNDSIDNWGTIQSMGGKAYVEKYWQPYFKLAKACSSLQDCGYANNTPWMNLNKTKVAAPCSYSYTYYLITTDGVILQFSDYDKSVTVDLNGIAGPNIYGKDVFAFKVSSKGVFLRGVSTTPTFCSLSRTTGDNGETCGGKIVVDGWKIKDDYPW